MKIQNFTEATQLAANDIFPVVSDPAGTPADKKITVVNLKKYIITTLTGDTAYDILSTDESITVSGMATGKTLTLPLASSCPGKSYVTNNANGSMINLTVVTTSPDLFSGSLGPAVVNIPYGGSASFVSDGVYWLITSYYPGSLYD